jgi:DMSO/TMAO reductase YedYZ heme-binding membrane subunit
MEENNQAPERTYTGPKLFSGAKRNWRFVAKFIAVSAAFWIIQYFYQVNFFGSSGPEAFVRSSAFSGATFISLSLLSSVIFKFKPVYARYWYVRRSLGVAGWFFILMHFWGVTNLYYAGDYSFIFSSLNPRENPVILGFVAYPIFFLMALTSTDWAVSKLGYHKWKTIHRLVYFAYLASVMHFLTVNPAAIMSLPGYVLLMITGLVLAGELYWFIDMVKKEQSSSRAKAVGILLILLWLLSIYFLLLK